MSSTDMFICGIAGAMASLTGKLALDEHSPVVEYVCYGDSGETTLAAGGSLGLRAIFVVAMLYSNALMIAKFLKALERGSSLVVTLVSSSMNLLVTGLLSQLVLDEELEEKWYLGALFIVAGILLVAISQSKGASAFMLSPARKIPHGSSASLTESTV